MLGPHRGRDGAAQPAGLKSALGENPKRAYGERNETPSTRLGTAAVIRGAFVAAQNYQAKLAASALKDSSERTVVDRDLKLEALSRVLRREIPWRQHCHRADDIATAMRMAREFGYDLVIDHGTEAYLLADQIAAAQIPVIIGPLFTSRSKVELRNRSLANPGRLAAAGVTIAITTDHPVVPIHFLIHQATLAVKEGLDPVTALRAVTINPARIIGCADRIGSLSVGKDADLVIWSGDPLDVMSRAERAFLDGREIYRYDYDLHEGVFAASLGFRYLRGRVVAQHLPGAGGAGGPPAGDLVAGERGRGAAAASGPPRGPARPGWRADPARAWRAARTGARRSGTPPRPGPRPRPADAG